MAWLPTLSVKALALRPRASRFSCLAALIASAGVPVAAPARAEPWPSQVVATYRIEFNGFDIGQFEFNSAVAGSGYTVSGDARLSALLGAFQWKGVTQTSGTLAGDAPRPAGYTFDYAGTGKQGAIRMGFTGDSVTHLAISPPQPPQPGVTQITQQHLKGVLDPLSALMAIARSDSANPCGRRLAIFDGKQRFDLTLSFKRQERVSELRPSGQPGVAYVCKVRYTPIAGHKANEETRTLAATHEIEVSLRPIPSANLFVPHQISMPTGAGTVRIRAQQVRIITPREQIALVH